jgi:hypothetical protein
MADFPDASGDSDDEMREEYDFRSLQGVVRGKYAARYAEQLRTVGLYKIHRMRLSASILSDDGFSDARLVSVGAIRSDARDEKTTP